MMIKKFFLMVCFLVTMGCVGIPENIKPVEPFDAQKYLGKWYEIARLDHSFERGLTAINAEYSLNEDQSLSVLNRGYSVANKEWKEAKGVAYFAENSNQGHLKVSFFRPFYASYVVFELDENYQYSLVTSWDKSYFWILARSPNMDGTLKATLIAKAKALGFETEKLIYVNQALPNETNR